MNEKPKWFIDLFLDGLSEINQNLNQFIRKGSAVYKEQTKAFSLSGYFVKENGETFTFIGKRENRDNETETLIQKGCQLKQPR